MRSIQENDVVVISMTSRDCFKWQASRYISHAKVVHVPTDVGDLFHFEAATNNGIVEFAINPQSSHFIGFTRAC